MLNFVATTTISAKLFLAFEYAARYSSPIPCKSSLTFDALLNMASLVVCHPLAAGLSGGLKIMLQSDRLQSAPKHNHRGRRHGSRKTWEFTRPPAPVGRDYRTDGLGFCPNKPFF
jgi:hypothetical protein